MVPKSVVFSLDSFFLFCSFFSGSPFFRIFRRVPHKASSVVEYVNVLGFHHFPPRNERGNNSSRPNVSRGRTWHRMNRGGRRGKEGIRGMRGKRGTGDGERARTRPADAPRRRSCRGSCGRRMRAPRWFPVATSQIAFSVKDICPFLLASLGHGALFRVIYSLAPPTR